MYMYPCLYVFVCICMYACMYLPTYEYAYIYVGNVNSQAPPRPPQPPLPRQSVPNIPRRSYRAVATSSPRRRPVALRPSRRSPRDTRPGYHTRPPAPPSKLESLPCDTTPPGSRRSEVAAAHSCLTSARNMIRLRHPSAVDRGDCLFCHIPGVVRPSAGGRWTRPLRRRRCRLLT